MTTDDEYVSSFSTDEEDGIFQDESDDLLSGNDDFADDYDEDNEEDDNGIDIGLNAFSKPTATNERKSYEVSYTVHQPDELRKQQEAIINELKMILALTTDNAAILLRHFHWNKERLIERYMDRPSAVLQEAGLSPEPIDVPSAIMVIQGFECSICYDSDTSIRTFALQCGHRFCLGCYRNYLTQKIMSEGESSRIECPEEGCHQIVGSKALEKLVEPDIYQRYVQLISRAFVEDREILKWCPAPDCPNAVECHVRQKDLMRIVPTVKCKCGHVFCFGCSLDEHLPAPCSLVRKWLKKCADDSETANWISSNTKECPKCNSTIEKNGGCNHMTCRKCRYEFCWMCMGLWTEHGSNYYSCNRFEAKSGAEARDAQAKSRISLQRYLHYYNRYANHEQSARLDQDVFIRTERKMMQLQSASGMSWIEVQYLQAAAQALQICRKTLEWTYAFAFYLDRDNLTEIFEDNQRDLEMAVEALSHMFEQPIADLAKPQLKVEIMDKTTYCNKRRVILLEFSADTLAKGRWKWNHGT